MEAEAFPVRYTRGVRAYWRRRKYHRLNDDKAGPGSSTTQKQLGGGWRRRLRVRVRAVMVTAPRRALARARDAYVGGMLVLARKASAAVALPGGPDSVWPKRVPRRKQQQLPSPAHDQPTEFEQRVILEIYKSLVASKELTTMLHSSKSYRQETTTTTPAGLGQHHTQMVHLLDM